MSYSLVLEAEPGMIEREMDKRKHLPSYSLKEAERMEEERKRKVYKDNISKKLRWLVWERDNFTCQHCGTRRYLSLDHIKPESKGGKTTETNLQTLCKKCNCKKGTKV